MGLINARIFGMPALCVTYHHSLARLSVFPNTPGSQTRTLRVSKALLAILSAPPRRVLNFCSDDPDELEVVPEVGHKQPERAADEAAAVKKVKAALTPALCKVLTQLLEELKAK